MSNSIENGVYDGDLKVTGDAVIEGDSTLKGDASIKKSLIVKGEVRIDDNTIIKRNLIVKGFIDAPNIKGPSKGLFKSEEALIAEYPHPVMGWWAVVCENLSEQSYDGILYVVERNEYNRLVWVNSGTSIDLSTLITIVQQFEDAIKTINNRIDLVADSVEELQAALNTTDKTIGDLVDEITKVEESAITSVEIEGERSVNVKDITDKEKPLEKIFSIGVNTATHNEDGLITAKCQTQLDQLTKHIVYFDNIIDEKVTYLDKVCEDVDRINYYVGNHAFLALDTVGNIYSKWEESTEWAKYKTNDDYMGDNGYPLQKIYMSDGLCYAFDSKLSSLKYIGDLSQYVSFDDTATEETGGIMSKEDKLHLNFLYDALNSGRVTNGTFRFLGVKTTTDDSFTINETDVATEYDGICWLEDKKMFCAYRAILVVGNVAYAHFTYYTHWDTEKFYMEKAGEERGLWKDKVYIYRGALYVWCNCDDALVKVSGDGCIRELTEDEIDEIMEDFVLVESGGTTGGIADVTAEGESPLNLKATPTTSTSGTEVKITGSIDTSEMSEEEVEELFK